MTRSPSLLIVLALIWLGPIFWFPGPLAAAEEAGDFRVLLFAPQISQYTEESGYYRLFVADLETHWSSDQVELRFFPRELLTDPAAISRILEAVADEPQVRAVVIGESPDGCVDGLARLRAKRPDMFLVAIEPHEELEKVGRVATLTLALNHSARGFIFPTLAHRMGARTIVYFSTGRHQALPQFDRQFRILSQVARDMSLILVRAFDGPDPLLETTTRAHIEEYLSRSVSRYLDQYGEDTAFVTTSTTQYDLLVPIVMRQGGSLLDAVQPSPLLGFPEALDLVDEARDLFGRWRQLLTVEDERIMGSRPSGNFSVWAYPYPHTTMLAMVDLVISAVNLEADIYDLKNVNLALEKHAPGAKWLVSAYTDYRTDALVSQVVLVLQDSYWFGHGYQGFTRLHVPSKYYRIQ